MPLLIAAYPLWLTPVAVTTAVLLVHSLAPKED